MTDWNLSIVIIVPAALQDKANRLSCALGHDVLPGNTFSVPLSDNGEDVTHYGCRTSAKQEFVDILQAAGEGQLPPDFPLDEFGVTAEDVDELFAKDENGKPVMIVAARLAGNDAEHFDDVLSSSQLQRVSNDDS